MRRVNPAARIDTQVIGEVAGLEPRVPPRLPPRSVCDVPHEALVSEVAVGVDAAGGIVHHVLRSNESMCKESDRQHSQVCQEQERRSDPLATAQLFV